MTITKHILGDYRITLEVAVGAQLLSCVQVLENLAVWFLEDETKIKIPRTFVVFKDGAEVKNPERLKFINTIANNSLFGQTWHVFEELNL